jgi:hypothetical protein
MARVLHEVKAVAAERRKRVSTGQMNRFLDKIDFQRAPGAHVQAHPHLLHDPGRRGSADLRRALFTDRDIKLHFSFERFLENQIREAFGFNSSVWARCPPIWFKVTASAQSGPGRELSEKDRALILEYAQNYLDYTEIYLNEPSARTAEVNRP